MALAMTPCFPVLSVSNFKAFGLNSTHQQYHPSPTREFKNLRMCTSRGLNKSSSLPAANRSRRGFEVFCEAVNKEAQEVIGYETEEAVNNVDHGFGETEPTHLKRCRSNWADTSKEVSADSLRHPLKSNYLRIIG
ncbi:hypothetical protein Sjap_016040 [Stephania japonica]|uniref:Uncharacterized protein n=1 Tax=Stephania japonica TaxID=461633 RepID=A0AAP0ILE2_9MAGN